MHPTVNVACHEHGTTLSGSLPASWEHLVASYGTARRVALGEHRKTARRYVQADQEAGLSRDAGPQGLSDELIGVVVGAVRPARPNGHGASWETLLSATIRGMDLGRLSPAFLNFAAVGNSQEIVEGVADEARTSGSPITKDVWPA